MSLQVPNQKPWMLILKASCMEDNMPAHHYKYYGMKVVGVIEGIATAAAQKNVAINKRIGTNPTKGHYR